jgi:histidine phosphotransferase ChpT
MQRTAHHQDVMTKPQQPPDMPALALAECLATRLCHDVAGLVGTLAGTLEMALEDSQPDAEAAQLATDATRLLGARIRLYRAAWGGGEPEGVPLATLTEGLPNRARVKLELATIAPGFTDDPTDPDALKPGGPRLLLCLLLAGCAGLHGGGTIAARPEPGGGFSMTLTGRHAAWPEELFGRKPAELEPRELAAPLAAMVAASLGWRLISRGDQVVAEKIGWAVPAPPNPPSRHEASTTASV